MPPLTVLLSVSSPRSSPVPPSSVPTRSPLPLSLRLLHDSRRYLPAYPPTSIHARSSSSNCHTVKHTQSTTATTHHACQDRRHLLLDVSVRVSSISLSLLFLALPPPHPPHRPPPALPTPRQRQEHPLRSHRQPARTRVLTCLFPCRRSVPLSPLTPGRSLPTCFPSLPVNFLPPIAYTATVTSQSKQEPASTIADLLPQ